MHLTGNPFKIVWILKSMPLCLHQTWTTQGIYPGKSRCYPMILPKQNLETNPHLKTSVWSKLLPTLTDIFPWAYPIRTFYNSKVPLASSSTVQWRLLFQPIPTQPFPKQSLVKNQQLSNAHYSLDWIAHSRPINQMEFMLPMKPTPQEVCIFF